MVINRKKCVEAATVAVPFLIGVIVGKLGLKDKKEETKKEETKKEDTVKTEEKKSEDTATDAKAKG